MGAIQNQINQTLGQASIAVGVSKHAAAEAKQAKIAEAKNQAEIAATAEQQAADKLAYKNNTIEAALAIHAHRDDSYKIGKETISRADYDAFDPKIGDKKLSEYSEKELSAALQNLDEAGIERLAKDVDDFRTNVLADMNTRRLAATSGLKETGRKTLERAKNIPQQVIPARTWITEQLGKDNKVIPLKKSIPEKIIPAKHIPGKYISNKDYKNQQLEKAYTAERELNDRIAASRELKFDIKAATEKISRLQQGGKK
jgi:hypothetical protein